MKPSFFVSRFWVFAYAMGFSGLMFLHGAFEPAENWDMIGYVASAYYHPGIDSAELQRLTFADIKETISANSYELFVNQTEYRKVVATNPESLRQQLPFYSIRHLYVLIIKAFASFGFTFAHMSYFVSALFAGLFSLALFAWSRKNLQVFFLVPIAFCACGAYIRATSSTPDTMASFFAILLLFLSLKEHRLRFVVAALLPWVRTDYVILCALLAAVEIYKKNYKSSLGLFLPAVVSYLWVNSLHQNYGYVMIFNFTFFESNPFPLELKMEKNIGPYLGAYWQGLRGFIEEYHFYLYLFFGIYWFKKIRPLKNQGDNIITFTVLGYVVLHFLLFPVYDDRFFLWTAALSILTLMRWTLTSRQVDTVAP